MLVVGGVLVGELNSCCYCSCLLLLIKRLSIGTDDSVEGGIEGNKKESLKRIRCCCGCF